MIESVYFAARRIVPFASAAAVSTVMLVLALLLGPNLEAALFPVIKDQEVEYVRLASPDRVEFSMLIKKARSCRLASLSWTFTGPQRHVTAVVKTLDEQDVAGRANLPTSDRVRIGPFFATVTQPSLLSDVDRIQGVLYYECHAGYLIEQVLRIPLPKDVLTGLRVLSTIPDEMKSPTYRRTIP